MTDLSAAGSAANNSGLQLSGLSKVLGGRTIIDDLSLSVNQGELVSLLGPSGCGKTTTLRMIAGFLLADSGTIRVGGRDVTKLGAEKRPSAMVFQNYALWPHMTVFRNVAFPLKLRRLPKPVIEERVTKVLDLVNMLHHKHSRPAQISGGEQQRVALARALVQEPELLLLDEPLSNLDAKLRVKVREDIREIQQRLGITMVIVTHDQDEAISISDRIAVMNGGKIEQYSTPTELYHNPKTLFVATFIGAINQLDGDYRDGMIEKADASLDSVVGIRAEDVIFTTEQVPDSHPATVERIITRGHFHEVLLKRADVTLRAYVSGAVPPIGSSGYVRIAKAMTFRHGVLFDESVAPAMT